MANNYTRDLAAKLSRLSPRERQVFKYRCLGWDYKRIAKTLVITDRSVKTYVNRIYDKLELKGYGRAARMKLLYEEYCPLLQEMEEPSKPLPEGPTEAVIEGEVREVIEANLSIEDEKMVDEDEFAIVLVPSAAQNPPPPPPDPDPKPKGSALRTLVVGVVLGICLSAGAVYLIFQSNILAELANTLATPTTPITSGEPTEAISLSPDPEIATQTPAIIEPVVVVTATSLPITPSPTQAPLPSIPLPFSDNFELRARPEWETITGTWRVLDGHFTGENNDQWQIVFVGDPNWRNYRIEVTSFSKDYIYPIRIIARASYEGYIAFEYYNWGSRWLLVKNGQEIELTSDTDRLYWDRTYNLKLEAKDDIFTVYMDGIQYSQIQDTTFSNGRVGIGYDSRYLTWFDDFQVTEIP